MLSLFFADSVGQEVVTLEPSESRHAEKVVRIAVGEEIRVADRRGAWIEGSVDSLSPIKVRVMRRGEDVHTGISVLQALTKGDAATDAVALLTEVGIEEIIPWGAHHSIARWDGEKVTKAREKWQVVAEESAKQSRRAFTPRIGELASPKELPELFSRFNTVVVLHESAQVGIDDIDLPRTGEVLIVVGPEGGISETEIATFAEDAQIVHLGPYVLRSKNAGAIAAALILQRRHWYSNGKNLEE
ncbi:MAG: 16S rRNA (uracil(1498)-N(3))-methyltransferase [Actinobacteria bacterium]|nr:16S rRNA (uracil(1498)-N(3))-methyltransferase [Actinomycetota bacterium]